METEGVETANPKENLICSVEYTNANKINRLSTTAQELLSAPPDSFLDVLKEWGCTWIWDNMQLTGGIEWLGEAIREN